MFKRLSSLALIILVMTTWTTKVRATDIDPFTTISFNLESGGSPITTERTIRLSLWKDSRMLSGDVSSGVINTDTENYAGYQTELTRTPNSDGYTKISFSELTDFPGINTNNAFMQVEHKGSGEAVSAYSLVKSSVMSGTIMDRYVLFENGLIAFNRMYNLRGLTSTGFILDYEDNAQSGEDITLQFGTTLGEQLNWDVDTARFDFSDDLHVTDNITGSGALATEGHMYTAGNLVLNKDNAAQDSTITFGNDAGTETVTFSDTYNRFEISDDSYTTGNMEGSGTLTTEGDINSANNLVLNKDNAAQDTTITFGNDALAETIAFSDTTNNFIFSDDLHSTNNLSSSGTIAITGTGTFRDDVIVQDLLSGAWLSVAGGKDTISTDGTAIFNQFGEAVNFRIESNNEQNMFFVDGTNDRIGIGTSAPDAYLQIEDSTSTGSTEWIKLDDGTNEFKILTGEQDPREVATSANTGSIFFSTSTGSFFIKQDEGSTISWNKNGFTDNILNALEGSYGAPSSGNTFVTNDDPRLSQSSGNFGEKALGARIDFINDNLTIDKTVIWYTRVFFTANVSIQSIGAFTTQSKTTDVNYGVYSATGTDLTGMPYELLAETGTQAGVSSPVDDFFVYDLTTPVEVSSAGFYWLAMALTNSPKAQTTPADDSFVPFRVESKAGGSTTLPSTANPDAKSGTTRNLPYLAAFDE